MDNTLNRIPLEMLADGAVTQGADAPLNTDAVGSVDTQGADAARSPEEIREQVVAALKTCYDPEIPANIHDIGLIYGIDVEPAGQVTVRMTLTSPMCPAAGSLPPEVQTKVAAVPGVKSAKVDLVWDPPWSIERMSEEVKLQLGLFDF